MCLHINGLRHQSLVTSLNSRSARVARRLLCRPELQLWYMVSIDHILGLFTHVNVTLRSGKAPMPHHSLEHICGQLSCHSRGENTSGMRAAAVVGARLRLEWRLFMVQR